MINPATTLQMSNEAFITRFRRVTDISYESIVNPYSNIDNGVLPHYHTCLQEQRDLFLKQFELLFAGTEWRLSRSNVQPLADITVTYPITSNEN